MYTVCNGLRGEDITCATCFVLALLPPLHKHFPHRYTSEIRHVNGLDLWLRVGWLQQQNTTTQQYTLYLTELLYMIFCFTAFTATVFYLGIFKLSYPRLDGRSELSYTIYI
jgi:hypothetical protein